MKQSERLRLEEEKWLRQIFKEKKDHKQEKTKK